MKPVLVVPGVVLFLVGLVWALQGADVLPTTVMTGTPWIVIGSVVAFAGVALAAAGILRT